MNTVPPSPVAPAQALVPEERKAVDDAPAKADRIPNPPEPPVREIGGRRDGTEPTRYGDWEKNGRCIDF